MAPLSPPLSFITMQHQRLSCISLVLRHSKRSLLYHTTSTERYNFFRQQDSSRIPHSRLTVIMVKCKRLVKTNSDSYKEFGVRRSFYITILCVSVLLLLLVSLRLQCSVFCIRIYIFVYHYYYYYLVYLFIYLFRNR